MWPGFVCLALAASASSPPVPDLYKKEMPKVRGWTPVKAELGRRLFFEKKLSIDETLSCASCHDPEKGFTDGLPVAKGVNGQLGPRNVPTLVNRALGKSQFFDGRAPSLEEQALVPIADPKEMALPIDEAVKRLSADPEYSKAFPKVMGGPPNAKRLGEALASYGRTIFAVGSPYDVFATGRDRALSPSATQGLILFSGKARCIRCHTGANFTDEKFHNVGIGKNQDPGRKAVTGKDEDLGKIKTPTLRELTKTAPYMHDGSIKTLAEVVDRYNKGGEPAPNLAEELQPLGLNDEELADIVSFLEALTGTIHEGIDKPIAR